jgi:hypothetical protein
MRRDPKNEEVQILGLKRDGSSHRQAKNYKVARRCQNFE